MSDTKIKVAILSRYQDTNHRGVERVVEDLKKYLSSEKIDVDILSGKRSDSWSVLKGNYDVVIPTNGRWQSLKVSWLRWLGGYKVLITGHSGLGWDDLWNLVVARPDVFVSLTQSTLDNWKMVTAKYLAIGVRVLQIPNGVDLSKYSPKGDKKDFKLPHPVILSVGALVPEKNHDLVINAVSRLDNVSLVVVGSGVSKSIIQSLGKQKLPNRFALIEADFEEMPKIYRGADLFTLPSWGREAFGVVYLEALATNLPVIAPDDKSRHEIVGQAGLYVDVGNSEEYAKGIKRALSRYWGVIPRKRAEKFDWKIVAEKYAELIISLVGNKK